MAEDKEIKTEVKEEEASPEKKVAKKPAAKKTTKKKTTSKKATTKKTSKKKTSKKSSSKKAEEAPKVDVETEEDKKAKEEAERKEKLKKKKVKVGDMVFVDVLGKTVEDEDPERSIVFQASNQEDAKLLINYDAEKSAQYVPDMAVVGKTGFVSDKIDAELEGMVDFVKYY